jgi:excisionase family DNA binding protein
MTARPLVEAASTARLVSIRRAAEILGVNQATVRQWSDSGKLRAFTTPGGHRRFDEQDLLTLSRGPTVAPGPLLGEFLLGTRESYEALARRCTAESSWYQVFDDAARRRFRILGSSMLNLIGVFLTGGRRDRDRALEEGRDVAIEYGAEAARLGLSLPQATEAFLLFRTPVLEGLNRWVSDRQPPRREADELSLRASYFMDQVLLSMASTHETRRIEAEVGG